MSIEAGDVIEDRYEVTHLVLEESIPGDIFKIGRCLWHAEVKCIHCGKKGEDYSWHDAEDPDDAREDAVYGAIDKIRGCCE